MSLRIVEPRGEAEMAAFRALNWDYRAFLLSLPAPDDAAVLAAYPEEKYRAVLDAAGTANRPPRGMMRLVLDGDRPVGCGTIQTFAPGDAEIKRVFIAPAARGKGAGRRLVEQLVADCRELSFRRILMDTGRGLTAAQALYDAMGFVRRGPYHDAPEDIARLLVFYEMALD
ncbi:GNAT family N-acetyltransferase [Roseibacterium sp. SDUM158017]|uniref:GNAT family N-acetyltransferase n=1 Tax=Roseicyclus salinarum TaxID=3036773 RepID=UPI002414EBA5|nr:GNAT family N-acetyltransferase [Roseibacterium sp. SDUM158017]MDG4648050.1 GNAT family N-acetyltransferase [Roseibacterium sp. SDUM158017]